jgi:3-oxoacyl-[acyl-carrier protein] reductase
MPSLSAPAASLTGLVAVVTGASGGIGRVVASELARQGAAVGVHGNKNRESAELLVGQLREIGSDAVALGADLSAETGRHSFAEAAWSWKSRIDVLVNLAGADVLTGVAATWSFEQKLETLWNVDCLATLELSRTIGQRMKHAGSGVILNIGWDQAEQGMAGDSGEMFAAVKGAVMAFSRSLAQSLAPQVRVNCLAPGWIRTAWGEKASDYWQERATRQALRGRWGTPEDVARAAVFLASPAADFITGQVIPINGGFKYE